MDVLKNYLYPCKNDILDPLSVIIKLFIYSYKPPGTKISIDNNKLNIQEIGLLQPSIRFIKRDSKNDINIIQFPIIYACEIYLSNANRDIFIEIFNKLLLTFDKLRETYQGNEIIYSIDQLKNIVDSFIKNSAFDPVTIITSYNEPSCKLKKNIYAHINTIWNKSRLNILLGYIDEIIQATNTTDLQNNLLNSLSIYMSCIDIMTNKLLEHFPTSR